VVDALKSRKVGFLAINVYEEESSLFFEDHSSDIINDDTFAPAADVSQCHCNGSSGISHPSCSSKHLAETSVLSLTEFSSRHPLHALGSVIMTRSSPIRGICPYSPVC
jgi:D-lactate dehydrogenase